MISLLRMIKVRVRVCYMLSQYSSLISLATFIWAATRVNSFLSFEVTVTEISTDGRAAARNASEQQAE
jgi:hypothetical protein